MTRRNERRSRPRKRTVRKWKLQTNAGRHAPQGLYIIIPRYTRHKGKKVYNDQFIITESKQEIKWSRRVKRQKEKDHLDLRGFEVYLVLEFSQRRQVLPSPT